MNDRLDDNTKSWIDSLSDGTLSPSDAHRLSARLLVDESARRAYLDAMEMQADLEWLHADRSSVPVSSNGKPTRVPATSFDWLDPVLQASEPDSLSPTSAVTPARSSVQTGHQSTVMRVALRLSKFALMASLLLVLSVAVVVAGERIYVFVREVLMPPRTTVADGGGGVLKSIEEERLVAGANPHGTRRIGSSAHSGVALANVFVYPLPPLDETERIHSARLEWTYKYRDSDPEFSVDLYGLGYVKPGDFVGQGFWEGEHDTAKRSSFGMEGSPSRRVTKIESGVMTPETPTGRIVVKDEQLVQFLRSLYDDGAQEGDLVVFRLNADQSTVHIRRTTGYAVVHPPVREHRSAPSELPLLSITAERGVPVDAYSVAGSAVSAQAITAHWASGSSASDRASILNGCDFNGVRRVGSSSWPDGGLTNVFMFTLPDISASERVDFASLEWTLLELQGDPEFSVDLYGLGFVAGDNFSGPCFWEGERDESLSADYGLSGPGDGRVKLLSQRVMTPDSESARIVVEDQSLTDYLQSLYANGARGGDLVVFRLNADRSTRQVPRATGYSIVHPPAIEGRTTQADLPVLRVTARE